MKTTARPYANLLALAVALCFCLPALAADDADCVLCHEQLGRQFETNVHARIASFEVYGGVQGCQSCHGDGQAHIDSGGDPSTILSLGEDMDPEASVEACVSCHQSAALHDWEQSAHGLNDVACVSCHKVHEDPGAVNYVDTCVSCHPQVAAQFRYPSHHPVMEGHMDCQSCHNPHGNSIGMLNNEERPAELCFSCHAEQQGPWIFEHEPVFEGCATCHEPHGAVANNLLTQNEPFLCLQCHEMHFHAGLEGEETETGQWYIPAYDADVPIRGRVAGDRPGDTFPLGMLPNPNGAEGYKLAFTTKCTQCHTMVHGSDSPSQTVPGQGKGLMR